MWEVDWMDGRFLSIDDYLLALRKGEIEVGKLTCERCVSALAVRERDT